MKLKYSRSARKDLENLRKYIAEELNNPSASERITAGIIKSCSRLKDFPMMGAGLKEKYGVDLDADIRILISGNYIISYKIEDSNIIIIRILDGRTDYLWNLLD